MKHQKLILFNELIISELNVKEFKFYKIPLTRVTTNKGFSLNKTTIPVTKDNNSTRSKNGLSFPAPAMQ